MTIKLKKNNAPVKAGYYLCQRHKDYRPEVAEVRDEASGLVMLMGIGIFPVKECGKSALWSDEILFT